jgi:hypothetical protein
VLQTLVFRQEAIRPVLRSAGGRAPHAFGGGDREGPR